MIHISYMSFYELVQKLAWNHLNSYFNIFCSHESSKTFSSIYKNGKSMIQNTWNYSKNCLNCFKYHIFCFQKFFKKLLWIYKNGKKPKL